MPSERAVRAVVDSFFTAIAREHWDSAAALVDLARFEPYFKEQVSNARGAIPPHEITVEEMMANDSTLPRAVAEWQVAQMKKYSGARSFGDMSFEFAGVHTQKELFALTVPEAAARWIEAQDERVQFREALRRMGCPLTSMPTEFPATKQTVLATSVANDSTAYVVHTDDRFSGDQFWMESERVMVLHKRDGHWRIAPRGNLLRPNGGSIGFAGECPKKGK